MEYKSCATWPKGTFDSLGNYTEDTHATHAAAKGVCDLLERNGAGGERKAFPLSTAVKLTLKRPDYAPDQGGCPPNCGHSDEEHIAFDIGVHDGEHGVTVPPIECCENDELSELLRDAWETGYSIGESNRLSLT